jgi:spondin-1
MSSAQTFVIKLLLLLASTVWFSVALKCDRTPEGITALRSQADGRFKLRILGEPDRYIPGENYTGESRVTSVCPTTFLT